MRPRPEMCIVNRDFVDDLAPMVGTNTDVMQRLGISWNSWIKIVAGMPVRKSLGLRLKERALAQAAAVDGFRRKFPCTTSADGIDREALDRAFLRPPCDSAAPGDPTLRSVRRAMLFTSEVQRARSSNER